MTWPSNSVHVIEGALAINQTTKDLTDHGQSIICRQVDSRFMTVEEASAIATVKAGSFNAMVELIGHVARGAVDNKWGSFWNAMQNVPSIRM
jgi:hypothetical protein